MNYAHMRTNKKAVLSFPLRLGGEGHTREAKDIQTPCHNKAW